MTNTIDNTDDVIDSRDVIARLEYLRDGDGLTDDEKRELDALIKLDEEGRDYALDWEYGAMLIRDSYFTDYARELLEDCGDIPKDIPHYIAIDWGQTAHNIRVDYMPVDFGNVTYWVR